MDEVYDLAAYPDGYFSDGYDGPVINPVLATVRQVEGVYEIIRYDNGRYDDDIFGYSQA